MNMVEDIRKQHLNTYKNATKEIVNNNTNSLVEGDIISLVKKPPLDSMDVIKTKLISLAKKEKIVLNAENLEKLVSEYRNFLEKELVSLIDIRKGELIVKIDSFEPVRETEIIKIQKKDMDIINKKIRQEVKKILEDSFDKELFINLDNIYGKNVEIEAKDSINKSFKRFMKSTYQKQLNENISIKILVKDRTLMSGIIEQGERYLFTKSNSHLFDQEIQNANYEVVKKK